VNNITTNSELTEEQVIEKLMELINAYSKPDVSITRNDALDIVCDALEFGEFYSLFEILDANATLEYVDEKRSVCGVKEIIDFIVDRPFLFAITNHYNIPLFAGIVNEP
jgi:hypothetical protein